jgi:hypothetical protein
MAVRTLNSTWKQLEKLCTGFPGKKGKRAGCAAIDDLIERGNESKIPDALANLLVRTYTGLEKTGLRFVTSHRYDYPEWSTSFDADANTILVNPVGVLRFHQACLEARKTLATPQGRENFQQYRLQAFMRELGRLPSRLTLFLLILYQVGCCKEVSKAEKRSPNPEIPEASRYLTLLWALKELETFIAENTGANLRAEHNLLWYESEWIAGTK